MTQLLPLLFGFSGVGFPCEPNAIPAEQPTYEEMVIAADYVGVGTFPAAVASLQLECLDERGFAAGMYYTDYSILLLADGWREDGGLTILVHEMYHHKQATEGLRMSECDAADAGARYAFEHGEYDRWFVEFSYGMRHCVGGQSYRIVYLDLGTHGISEVDPGESEQPRIEESLLLVFPELRADYEPQWLTLSYE